MQIVFIGGGNMAAAMIGGLVAAEHPASDIHVVDRNAVAGPKLRETYGVQISQHVRDAEATAAIRSADIVVLAVKPQGFEALCADLKEIVTPANPLLSIAAGVTVTALRRWLGAAAEDVMRAMPNTPALVGKGMTGVFAPEGTRESSREAARAVLTAAGDVLWLDREEDVDAVTAISGSGPAYVFYIMDAMQQKAVELGLSAEAARHLVGATFAGAAEMAKRSDLSLEQLRLNVTSKGGTTAAAIASFDAAHCVEIVKNAVGAAHARSVEMRGQ